MSTHDITLSYCEVFGACLFFKNIPDIPTELDIIKWWLRQDANFDK